MPSSNSGGEGATAEAKKERIGERELQTNKKSRYFLADLPVPQGGGRTKDGNNSVLEKERKETISPLLSHPRKEIYCCDAGEKGLERASVDRK